MLGRWTHRTLEDRYGLNTGRELGKAEKMDLEYGDIHGCRGRLGMTNQIKKNIIFCRYTVPPVDEKHLWNPKTKTTDATNSGG